MNFLKNLIIKLHFLSFDVALGTFIQAMAIQKFTEFQFSLDYLILLPLTTLIIYWLDRILDVYKLNYDIISTKKHQFYWNNFYQILIAVVSLGLFVIIKGLFFSDKQVQTIGIYGGLVVGLYFFVHHIFKGNPNLIYFKELSIALIYSLILWILPLSYEFEKVNFLAFICLFCHALLNLWIISFWDKELDISLETHSFGQFVYIQKFITYLFIITMILCGVLMYYDKMFGFTNFLMLQGHYLLFRAKEFYYRKIFAELIFWIPIFYLIQN